MILDKILKEGEYFIVIEKKVHWFYSGGGRTLRWCWSFSLFPSMKDRNRFGDDDSTDDCDAVLVVSNSIYILVD